MSNHHTALETAALSRLAQSVGKEKGPTVLALSGGCDSVALLHLLVRLREKNAIGSIICAHFNHQLRGRESEEDEAFVRSLAESWSVDLRVGTIDGQTKALKDRSPELTARLDRYRFLTDTAGKVNSRLVMTAHHEDDQCETVFYRILRGTGLRGLRGMRSRRVLEGSPSGQNDIILERPLLTVPQRVIREHVETHRLQFREDSSNRSLEPTRNRIRHEILPLITEKIHPGARASLLRLAERANGADEALEVWSYQELKRLLIIPGAPDPSDPKILASITDSELGLDGPSYRSLPREVRYRVASHLLGNPIPSIAESEFDRFEAVAYRKARAQTLTDGTRITRREDVLVLQNLPAKQRSRLVRSGLLPCSLESEPLDETDPRSAVALPIPGKVEVPWAGVVVETTQMKRDELGDRTKFPRSSLPEPWTPSTPYVELMDAARVTEPVVVRSRRPGDIFHPLGATGTRKLKRFLIDSRVPRPSRDRLPLIVADESIVCVGGLRIADSAKITETTRDILRVTFTAMSTRNS